MGALRNVLEALGGDHHLLGSLQDGISIAQKKNIPRDVLESIYALGFSHYQAGNVQKAHDLFFYLSFHDHTNPRFVAGFGASCFQMGKKEQAVQVLEIAADMDPSDPGPVLNLAQTLESLGEQDKARDTLLKVLARAAQHEQFKPVKAIAEAMMERLAPTPDLPSKGA